MTFNSKIINNILDKIFPLPEQFGVVVTEYCENEPINFSKSSIFFNMYEM